MTPSRPEPTRILHPDDTILPGTREVAVEAPVAIEVDGLGYAVMMMTPQDLAAFATGFMLTERLADTAADIADIDVFAAPAGFLLVTSRISFEMVDKALVAGTPLLAGISAPTSLAVDHARAHGLTLVALGRSDTALVLNDPYGVFGSCSTV